MLLRPCIPLRALLFALAGLLLLGARPVATGAQALPDRGDVRDGVLVHLPASYAWMDSGIDLEAGRPVTIMATGRVQCGPCSGDSLGPEGTYFYEDCVAQKRFPLPAADWGPAPCYCLIGRIENGPPFYIGRYRSWRPKASGRLFLAVNDFDPSDNTGEFAVLITRPPGTEPVGFRRHIASGEAADSSLTAPGAPVPCSSVVVFYVDGLRPDVVEEMAVMGHLPNFQRYFLEGGTRLSQAVTVFPSNTITSNGTLWTGRFSDRHGLKSQTRFSRRSLRATPHLDTLGPSETAGVLGRRGLDRVGFALHGAGVRLMKGKQASRRWRQSQTTETPALYDYVRRNGQDWAPSVLPINPDIPPSLWTRTMINELPLLGAHEAIFHLDAANARYAIEQQFRDEQAVTVVWLPDVDTHSHHKSRGQFGASRRVLAQCDGLIGLCIDKLRRTGRLENTYLMVVSDHGHTGGRRAHLERYDLAHEFFYAPRQVTSDGRWIAGGLGMSVREHREHHRHEGDGRKQFVFLDALANGAARIFLPKGAYDSGCWRPPNTFAELAAYRVAEHLPPVNLIERLTRVEAHASAGPGRPIDLVLAKLDEHSIVVANGERGWAVIERQRGTDGRFHYRYQVLADYHVGPDGVHWQPAAQPNADPLRLLEVVSPEFLSAFHDESTWLEVTLRTPYPDSVVALSRHMLWDAGLEAREEEYAPDLVVTAAPGWFFGTQNEPGTSHGHPLRDTMLFTWLVAGPNVRRGTVLDQPHRSVDVLPTVLEMAGVPFAAEEMDGRPLRSIYEIQSIGIATLGGTVPLAKATPGGRESFLPNRRRVSQQQKGPSVGLATGPAEEKTPDPFTRHRDARWNSPRNPGAPSSEQIGTAFVLDSTKPNDYVPVYWEDVDLQAWAPLDYRPRPEYHHHWADVHRYDDPCDLHNIVFDVASIGDWEVVRLLDDAAALLGRAPPFRAHFDRGGEKLDELRHGHIHGRWLAEGADALQLPHVALGDYSYTSSGNLHRASLLFDWVQGRYAELDSGMADVLRLPTVTGAPLVNAGLDHVQDAAGDVHRTLQRIALHVTLRGVVEPVEDTVGLLRNAGKAIPAEVVVRDR